jgi:hypothetical protein
MTASLNGSPGIDDVVVSFSAFPAESLLSMDVATARSCGVDGDGGNRRNSFVNDGAI